MRTKFKASDLKEAARNLHKGNYHILMLFGVADMLEEYACIRQKIDINKTIEVADEKQNTLA